LWGWFLSFVEDVLQMDPKPIGVFDSGVGGLTVLKQLCLRMPYERLLYLGDTARLPYGTKSKDTVVKYSMRNAAFLVEKGVKCLVVACNTASSLALEELKRHFAMPVIGVIHPGARKAATLSRLRRVGVIGTLATVRSRAYEEAIEGYGRDIEVTSVPCPLFVALAEEGWVRDEVTYQVAERYLGSLKNKRIDVLVLGCTHYPLLKPVLSEVMGKDVVLVDSAEEVADEVVASLHGADLAADRQATAGFLSPAVYLTDCSLHFVELGERILEAPLKEVEYVDLG
jgi:glutamate racemase